VAHIGKLLLTPAPRFAGRANGVTDGFEHDGYIHQKVDLHHY
jgi:hypothetical protein